MDGPERADAPPAGNGRALSQMSEVELELEAYKVIARAQQRTNDLWKGLSEVWQVMPITAFGGGWLVAIGFARYMPDVSAFLIGLAVASWGILQSGLRLRKTGKMRVEGFALEALEPIEREMKRRLPHSDRKLH